IWRSFGMACLLQLAALLSLTRPAGETEAPDEPAEPGSSGIPARIAAIALPTRATASSFSNRPKRSNSGRSLPLQVKQEMQTSLAGAGIADGRHRNSARSLPLR